MADREKVILGLEHCTSKDGCKDCPYSQNNNGHVCAFNCISDALSLLNDTDHVKVVRCRDCESWWPDTNEENCSSGFCRNQFSVCCGQTTDMNWFCADGEREG